MMYYGVFSGSSSGACRLLNGDDLLRGSQMGDAILSAGPLPLPLVTRSNLSNLLAPLLALSQPCNYCVNFQWEMLFSSHAAFPYADRLRSRCPARRKTGSGSNVTPVAMMWEIKTVYFNPGATKAQQKRPWQRDAWMTISQSSACWHMSGRWFSSIDESHVGSQRCASCCEDADARDGWRVVVQ